MMDCDRMIDAVTDSNITRYTKEQIIEIIEAWRLEAKADAEKVKNCVTCENEFTNWRRFPCVDCARNPKCIPIDNWRPKDG